MKRSPLLVLAPLVFVCTLSGCSAWEGILEENPVTEKAFWAGAAVGGVPVMVAFSPITLPLAFATEGREAFAPLIIPGLPTGLVGGVALGLPVLILETIVRLPYRLWKHATGRALERDYPPEPEGEPKPVSLPRPEPVTPPEPAPASEDDSPYRNWPKLGRVPRRVAWPRDVPR